MRIGILGLGAKTGMSLVKFFAPKAQVHVFDQMSIQECERRLTEVGIENVICHPDTPTGEPMGLDKMIVSPGVPWNHPLLHECRNQNISIQSEIDVAGGLIQCPIIAITGSLGKSTVTQLLGEVLRQKFRHVFIGGNLGTPLIEAVDGQWDIAVVEVSSFQLEQSTTFHPQGAIVLNLHENHLDRHQTMDAYLSCKQNIYQQQTEQDWILFNAEQPQLVENQCRAAQYTYSAYQNSVSTISSFEEGFAFEGHHSAWASRVLSKDAQMIAHWVGQRYGIAADRTQTVIENFRGLPHRCETVLSNLPCLFVNDSKSTTPASTFYAIDQCSQPVRLLLGGRNKGMNLELFASQLSQHAHLQSIHVFGEVAEQLCAFLPKDKTSRHVCLDDALQEACRRVSQGDVVLLSPAFASFDQYENMAQRGEHFKTLVASLELFSL